MWIFFKRETLLKLVSSSEISVCLLSNSLFLVTKVIDLFIKSELEVFKLIIVSSKFLISTSFCFNFIPNSRLSSCSFLKVFKITSVKLLQIVFIIYNNKIFFKYLFNLC